jgi:hypothetical protein
MMSNRRKLRIGLIGLASFAVVFMLWVVPWFGGRSGLDWADSLFNQLSKESSYFVPALREDAKRFDGRSFDVLVPASSQPDAARLCKVARTSGAEAEFDGKAVRVRGDLAAIARAAMDDAEALHRGQAEQVQAKYGFTGRDVIYAWWLVFGSIYKSCMDARDLPTSNFASSIRTRVCEPAYNFAAVQARSPADAFWPMTILLAFYVLYTIWFGFSIMFIVEGLGVSAKNVRKRET